MAAYDAIVVGAGVTGSAVARELSRRNGRFLVVERASDVCEGTSKANSAIVHAGFDAEPGTLKAKMNVRGNQLMDQISEELDVPFSRVGAFVVCLREEELPRLEELYQRGLKNGVPDLELLTGDEAKALEPNLTDEVCGALWARTSGIVCPFALTLGLAESAAKNGVEFSFGTAVTGLEKTPEGWLVKTNQGDFTARAVVNAAGVYSDTLHNWACEEKLSITPRKGEYCLLDKTAGGHVSRTIFQLPGKYGKGGTGVPHHPREPAGGPHRRGRPRPGGHRHHRRRHRRPDGEGGPEREKRAHAPGHHLLYGAAGPRGRGRLRPGGDGGMFLRRRGHREPGADQRPGHRGVSGRAHRRKAGPFPEGGVRPPSQRGAPPGGHERRGAGGEDPGEPGLREHHLPVRGSERGRDLRRHPRHSGGQDLRRGQAPHQGGHGPLPGGLLLPPGDGPALPGAGAGSHRDPEKTARIPRLCWKRPGAEEEAEP